MSKMRLRGFENAPGQRHVSEDDRYLYRQEEPRYRFVVIGTGTMGQEHMRVAALFRPGANSWHLRFSGIEHGYSCSQFSFAAVGTLGAVR